MSEEDIPAAPPRKTLKLKQPILKERDPPPPAADRGAARTDPQDWAAAHKRRMQADMDMIAGKK